MAEVTTFVYPLKKEERGKKKTPPSQPFQSNENFQSTTFWEE